MERIIVQNLLRYLHQHGLISTQQHGFLMRKSTTTNLLETLNDWSLASDSKDGVTIAYIDFTKTFDSVSHTELYHKLQGYGISGNVLAVCLGTILFVIYINDIVSMFDQCCVCKLYTDDLKLYMRMSVAGCAHTFQKCIDSLTF